jgi:cyclic pyranopterin phosphate synthase
MRAGATDEELTQLIRSTWEARTDRYSERRSAVTVASGKRRRIEMFQIGG